MLCQLLSDRDFQRARQSAAESRDPRVQRVEIYKLVITCGVRVAYSYMIGARARAYEKLDRAPRTFQNQYLYMYTRLFCLYPFPYLHIVCGVYSSLEQRKVTKCAHSPLLLLSCIFIRENGDTLRRFKSKPDFERCLCDVCVCVCVSVCVCVCKGEIQLINTRGLCAAGIR